MSHVTDIILITQLGDECHVDDLNEWMNIRGFGRFLLVGNPCGGSKALQCDLYAAAHNKFGSYLAADRKVVEGYILEFVRFFKQLPWEGHTLLIIKDEHDERFTIFEGGK